MTRWGLVERVVWRVHLCVNRVGIVNRVGDCGMDLCGTNCASSSFL